MKLCPSCKADDNNPYENEYGQKMRACGRCMIQWADTAAAPAENPAPPTPMELSACDACGSTRIVHATDCKWYSKDDERIEKLTAEPPTQPPSALQRTEMVHAAFKKYLSKECMATICIQEMLDIAAALAAPRIAAAPQAESEIEQRNVRGKEWAKRTGKSPSQREYIDAFFCGYFNHPQSMATLVELDAIRQFEEVLRKLPTSSQPSPAEIGPYTSTVGILEQAHGLTKEQEDEIRNR